MVDILAREGLVCLGCLNWDWTEDLDFYAVDEVFEE